MSLATDLIRARIRAEKGLCDLLEAALAESQRMLHGTQSLVEEMRREADEYDRE